jgi:hypothetical protein
MVIGRNHIFASLTVDSGFSRYYVVAFNSQRPKTHG